MFNGMEPERIGETTPTAPRRGERSESTARSGTRKPGRLESTAEAAFKGAEPDARHELCTPGSAAYLLPISISMIFGILKDVF